jgi:hypothetical protein
MALRTFVVATLMVLLAAAGVATRAEQQGAPQPAAPAAGLPRVTLPGPLLPSTPQGRGSALPIPVREDDSGFVALFDGKTLTGWDGNPEFWRVEDGMIVGETKPDTNLTRNTFLIWRGGNVKDFEMKIEVQLAGDLASANSGLMYRAVPAGEPWSIKGYQADMDLVGYYSGNLHGERDCPCQLAPRGQFARAGADGIIKLVGTISDADTLKGHLIIGGWNRYHLVVRGNVHALLVNGHLTSVFINDHADTRWAAEGVMGLQLHTGPSEKVMFRNILYKKQ